MLMCVALGFSSGLPLYLLLQLLPAWLRSEGLNLKTIAAFAFMQLPYTWKFLWAPLMDRYSTMLGPCLENRRVFFSSCEVMQEGLASALISNTGCYSVVGPYKNINFDRAAAYWSAFYHIMLRDDAKSIKRIDLQKRTSALQKIFGVQMRYFAKSSKEKNGFIKVDLLS